MKKKRSILMEAEAIINGERQDMYGHPEDSFETIAKGWSAIVNKDISSKQVGLMMIWLKVARETNKPKRDNLVDIAGYAGCVERIVKKL